MERASGDNGYGRARPFSGVPPPIRFFALIMTEFAAFIISLFRRAK